jgi:16S rRNA (cytosine967-C5)-methyltransferase
MKWVLRLGVVQLCRMKGQEAYAVVDTSVGLAKKLGFGRQSGLVNAVLRGVLRDPPSDSETATGDPEGDLATSLSHPRWLVSRWLARYGPQVTEAILRWNNTPPRLSFRIRGDARSRAEVLHGMRQAGVDPASGAVLPDMHRLKAGFLPEESPWLAEGRIVIQDESEALVSCLWDPEPPVIDVCAGPGTKSGHLADRVGPTGLVVGWDLVWARAARVRETGRRLGRPNLLAVQADAMNPPVRGGFRSVLVDAPCTNLGVLCRRPDARWIRRPEEISERASLQRKLLEAAVDLLAPGGYVVYSVCTLEPEETEDVIAPLLLESGGRIEIAELLPSVPETLIDDRGCLRILPGTMGMEGVFAALLRKN